MADAYPYVLFVDFNEDGNPRLKTKLVKYFQSKKANGGDCEIEYESPSRTATLRFATTEARQRVLEKQNHVITWEERALPLLLRLPSDKGESLQGTLDGGEKTCKSERMDSHPMPPSKHKAEVNAAAHEIEDSTTLEIQRHEERPVPDCEIQTEVENMVDLQVEEFPCSTSSVLGNIIEEPNQEFLELLVENVMKNSGYPVSPDEFSVEFLPDACSAVVTFHSGKENDAFITNCPNNRTFKKKKLSVCPLEVTNKVRIEEMQNVNHDYLCLYFENEGIQVENVELLDEEHCAVVTFNDFKAVYHVIEKRQKKPLKVFPFYDSLGTALYGKDKPTLKLPADLSESIDSTISKYLHDKQDAAKNIQIDLEKHFCKVDFQQSTVRLSAMPSLLRRKGVKTKDIREWSSSVKMALEQILSNYKSLQFPVLLTAWEESEAKIKEAALNKSVIVVPDKDKGVLRVGGLKDDINALEKTFQEILNRISKRIQRENLSISEKTKLLPSVYHILSQDGLQNKILLEYPELKMTYDKESQFLTLHGLSEEVFGTKVKIMDGMLALKRKISVLDDYVIEFLKSEDGEKLTHSLLTSKGIDAGLEMSGNRVQLIAVSDTALDAAEDELKRLLDSKCIPVEDCNILKMLEWQNMVKGLERTTNSIARKVMIQTLPSQQVIVSGFKDDIFPICSTLEDFLYHNTEIEEVITVKSDTIARYIEDQKKIAWSTVVKDIVTVSFKKEAIYLRGSRAHVKDCKESFDDVVSSVVFDFFQISKPGAKKFFQDPDTMYASSAMTATGCLIQLVDQFESQDEQDYPLDGGPKPIYKLQTPDGIEIAVSKGDMCNYPVNTVVNASNRDLKHTGGLAAALLRAAGPQLQEKCNIIRQKGQLKPGDCVVTGAGGQLRCNHIIHAVGPHFDPKNPQKTVGQLRRAVKRSLELATERGQSVAVPAISRNQGFGLDLCANTIVKALKEYCDDNYGNNTLRKIHLVNNDDGAVRAMEASVKEVFGNSGLISPPHGHSVGPIQSQQVGSAQNIATSGKMLTTEGLCINIKKGNIQDATTEVVVNTVGEDLILSRGAVSSAIFAAAGQKLQDLINNQNKGQAGDVIITDGCQLKSSKVFHTIALHWDNGLGIASQILRKIVNDCLSHAEDNGLASITFPAIGTGNLGFPRNLVASLMLDEVLKFSSKRKPKTLKEVVFILHPGDAATVRAFTDEFKKRHTLSAGVVPTSSPQSNVSKGPFSKISSTSSMHEAEMGNVKIQVVLGDITKETSDIIVNSSNDNFTLKSGVSKAILDAAGQTVEVECQQLGSQPNQHMILTQPGNLKCKKILHVVGQSQPQKITKTVKYALQSCIQNSYTSISFPAIGTGQGKLMARQVADAMFDAVVDVLGQNTISPLKTFRIVIFQPAMLNDFYSSMKMKESNGSEAKGRVWKVLDSFFSFFTTGSASTPEKDKECAIVSRKIEPACFHICGDTQASVDSAKKWISGLFSKYQTRKVWKDENILMLSAPDRQRLVDIQATLDVQIEFSELQKSLTIEGLSTDVVAASTELDEMLKKARNQEELNKNIKMASRSADWQFEVLGQQFQSFDPTTNFHLERALADKQQFLDVFIQGQPYRVSLPEGPATNTQGKSLRVRRIDKLASDTLPKNWDPMPANSTFQLFHLQPASHEYNDVLRRFQASCNRNILKIERIQNPTLWQSLQIKKRELEKRNGHQNNEKILFHGTCHTAVGAINQYGFNRSYAGKNAAAYGNGTYFAVNARYSASDTYSRPDPQGRKFMYLCRVLTGDYTKGTGGLTTPPSKTTNPSQNYDSVVDNPATPSMFIVFHDQMAYPEYLITFK